MWRSVNRFGDLFKPPVHREISAHARQAMGKIPLTGRACPVSADSPTMMK